jgi:hypothetical protein
MLVSYWFMIIDSFLTPHINRHDIIASVGLVSCFINTIQVSITRISQFSLPIGYVYVTVFFLVFDTTPPPQPPPPNGGRRRGGGGLFIGNLDDVRGLL